VFFSEHSVVKLRKQRSEVNMQRFNNVLYQLVAALCSGSIHSHNQTQSWV